MKLALKLGAFSETQKVLRKFPFASLVDVGEHVRWRKFSLWLSVTAARAVLSHFAYLPSQLKLWVHWWTSRRGEFSRTGAESGVADHPADLPLNPETFPPRFPPSWKGSAHKRSRWWVEICLFSAIQTREARSTGKSQTQAAWMVQQGLRYNLPCSQWRGSSEEWERSLYAIVRGHMGSAKQAWTHGILCVFHKFTPLPFTFIDICCSCQHKWWTSYVTFSVWRWVKLYVFIYIHND